MKKYIVFKNPPIRSLGYVEFKYRDAHTEIEQTCLIPCAVHSFLGEKLVVCPMGHDNCITTNPNDFLIPN